MSQIIMSRRALEYVLSPSADGHGHGHGHGHGLVTKKKSHISETGRFNPLKSNSPLYKPHQMGPLQERNFFFLNFFRPQKKLTLPLFRWGLTGSGSTLADFGAHIHITNFLRLFISVLMAVRVLDPFGRSDPP